MNAELQKKEHTSVPAGLERRKYTRYRFIDRLYIRRSDGYWFTAMTYEISAGGLSAATIADFAVGDRVSLSPVAGHRVQAIIRRKQGALYGFEFMEIPAQIQQRIKELCGVLPPYLCLTDALGRGI